jgi:hypothetical protein
MNTIDPNAETAPSKPPATLRKRKDAGPTGADMLRETCLRELTKIDVAALYQAAGINLGMLGLRTPCEQSLRGHLAEYVDTALLLDALSAARRRRGHGRKAAESSSPAPAKPTG